MPADLDDKARADQIRARADAAPLLVPATLIGIDIPWLLDRLAAATERADKAEAAVERVRTLANQRFVILGAIWPGELFDLLDAATEATG